jgi:hypothetical protein
MAHEKSINMLRRMRDARVKKLGEVKPFIAGTISEYKIACGNPRCKCARGEKHTQAHLTYKDADQKTVSVYIPVDKRQEVAQWVEEYKRLKELIAEISDLQEQMLRRHVREKRLKKGRP